MGYEEEAKDVIKAAFNHHPSYQVAHCQHCDWPFHCPASQKGRIKCRACESRDE